MPCRSVGTSGSSARWSRPTSPSSSSRWRSRRRARRTASREWTKNAKAASASPPMRILIGVGMTFWMLSKACATGLLESDDVFFLFFEARSDLSEAGAALVAAARPARAAARRRAAERRARCAVRRVWAAVWPAWLLPPLEDGEGLPELPPPPDEPVGFEPPPAGGFVFEEPGTGSCGSCVFPVTGLLGSWTGGLLVTLPGAGSAWSTVSVRPWGVWLTVLVAPLVTPLTPFTTLFTGAGAMDSWGTVTVGTVGTGSANASAAPARNVPRARVRDSVYRVKGRTRTRRLSAKLPKS